MFITCWRLRLPVGTSAGLYGSMCSWPLHVTWRLDFSVAVQGSQGKCPKGPKQKLSCYFRHDLLGKVIRYPPGFNERTDPSSQWLECQRTCGCASNPQQVEGRSQWEGSGELRGRQKRCKSSNDHGGPLRGGLARGGQQE